MTPQTIRARAIAATTHKVVPRSSSDSATGALVRAAGAAWAAIGERESANAALARMVFLSISMIPHALHGQSGAFSNCTVTVSRLTATNKLRNGAFVSLL